MKPNVFCHITIIGSSPNITTNVMCMEVRYLHASFYLRSVKCSSWYTGTWESMPTRLKHFHFRRTGFNPQKTKCAKCIHTWRHQFRSQADEVQILTVWRLLTSQDWPHVYLPEGGHWHHLIHRFIASIEPYTLTALHKDDDKQTRHRIVFVYVNFDFANGLGVTKAVTPDDTK